MAQPGYLLVLAHSLDMAKMANYSAALPPIYQKYEGQYLGIGGPGRGVELLEGGWFDHSLVLARFPTTAAAEKFWASPEYAKAKALRKDAGYFHAFALPGNGNEAPAGEPGFLISVYRIFDAEAFKDCAAKEEAVIAKRGFRYLTRAKYADAVRLEGDLLDFDFSIIAFPTQASAINLWNDPGFRALRETRAKVSGINTFLMTGLPRKA